MDKGEFRGAWTLVLAACVGFGLGLSGLPFYTAGVFVDPLIKAFGWSAAQTQSGLLVMLWSLVALSPAAGWAADRFGARRVALVSIALFGAAIMSLSRLGPDLTLYRLNWALVAVAGAGTLPVIWSRAVNARFVRARGLALGLVLAGSGLTGLLAPPIAAGLIAAVGWRNAYLWLGAAPIVVALPLVALWFRDAPRVGAQAPAPAAPGATLAQALASPRFWLIALCIAAAAAGAAGCIPNLIKILVAHGQPRQTAVWIASLVGLCVILGRAASGLLIDRFWAPAVAAGFLAAPAVGCLLMVYGPPGLFSAVALAVLVGLAAGAEFDLLAYLTAAYFGMRRYGAVYGSACAVFSLAAGAAPLAFAAVFDSTGSYDAVLAGAALVFLASGAGLLLLGPYPRFHVDVV